MAFGINGISSFKSLDGAKAAVNGWNKSATTWFHPPIANPTGVKVFSNGIKTGPKSIFRNLGIKLNGYTYKAANSVGSKMLTKIGQNGSWLSKIATKVPGIKTVATGLSKLGKSGGSKIPGLGTIVAVGTGLWGVVKAAGKALKGDFKGAGHQLVKSAGSVAGIAAGIALMATGVGFLPGLALAVGAGFAGDWVGKKAADTVFGPVDEKTGYSMSYLQKTGQAQQANQSNDPYYNYLMQSQDQFNTQVDSILKSNFY